jgi:hypothetical protein
LRRFYDLNPQTELFPSWHIEDIAAKLTAMRQNQSQQRSSPAALILNRC